MKRSENTKETNWMPRQAPPEKAVLPVAPQQNALQQWPEAGVSTGGEIEKVATTVTRTPEGRVTLQVAKSLDAMLKDLRTPTGTRNDEVAFRIIEQVGNSLQRNGTKNIDGLLIEAISTIAEMAPQNSTEAMLATQMIATHEASLMFMRRATAEGQTFEGSDANVLRATRLMRLHLEQCEAMQKLKGKAGQQRVIVEHVHVHKGGQAIVGAVNAAKTEPGGGDNREN
ncbi:MAG: hypothetical protein M3N41_05520 [Acidobacteriota bacterium]|nr:hypothetical protein [Acidobacteriota bacterium]